MNMNKGGEVKLIALSLSHMVNDWYMNFMQVMIPFFAAAGMRTGRSAFLVTAFTATSALMQPVFGYLTDRTSRGWAACAGTLWMSLLLGCVGLEKSYTLMFATVLLAGLGTAAFHPQASAMVAAVAGKRKGFRQALFVAFGNVGWALAPLLLVPFIGRRGLESTPLLAVPGLASAAALWFVGKGTVCAAGSREARSGLFLPEGSIAELARIVTVVACRSLVYFGLIAFLPLYFAERGMSAENGSRLLFLMLFAGALGGLAGGYLSDRWSRKGVIIASMFLSSALFAGFLNTRGALSVVFLGCAGAFLLASFSVTVVLAHDVLRGGAATASGLVLGFGTGVGGLGVGLLGLVVERSGSAPVIHLLAALPVAAGILAFMLRDGTRNSAVEEAA